MVKEDVYWYATTSGTTGQNKYFPLSRDSILHSCDAYVLRGVALSDMEYFKKNGKHIRDGKVFVVAGGVEYKTKTQNQSYGSIITAHLKLFEKLGGAFS